MKSKKLIFLILIIFIGLILFINKIQIQGRNQNKKVSSPTPTTTEIQPYQVSLYEGQNFTFQVGLDGISMNPCESSIPTECPSPSMYLDKKTYPELFKVYDQFTRIDTQMINDLVNGKTFVFFTGNVPDHGGYATLYGVIVDPQTQSVVFKTPKELKSPLAYYEIIENGSVIHFVLNPYLFNNSCNSCRLEIEEYITFDKNSKKYVSVNSRYSAEFKKLLATYEKAASDCYYQGKQRTVTEVLSLGGKDARCGDENMDNKPFTADSGAITVGEFLEIKNKIQKIVDGNELSLAHY